MCSEAIEKDNSLSLSRVGYYAVYSQTNKNIQTKKIKRKNMSNQKDVENNKKGFPKPKKEYRGNVAPSDKLVETIVTSAKAACTTNVKTFVIRDFLELLNSGLELNLKHIVAALKEHGKDVKVVVKDDSLSYQSVNEFEEPAGNIGRSIIPISIAAGKGKVPVDQFTRFTQKTSNILKEIADLENEAVDIIVDNNISLKDVQSQSLKKKASNRREKDVQKIKADKVRTAEKQKKEKLKKEKALEQVSNPVEKKAAPVEKTEKTNAIVLPAMDSKNITGEDGWKEFAKANNIDLGKLTKKEDIYAAIKKSIDS